MRRLSPEKRLEIQLYLNRCSVPCKAINYLKLLWEDYILTRQELERLHTDPEEIECQTWEKTCAGSTVKPRSAAPIRGWIKKALAGLR